MSGLFLFASISKDVNIRLSKDKPPSNQPKEDS